MTDAAEEDDLFKLDRLHIVKKFQIVSKNSIFRKNNEIKNLNFLAKNWWIIVIKMHWSY